MSYAPRLRINPPLVLTSEQAAEGLEILDEALTELARNRSGRAVTAS
jgi:4-aminobutyrate aminotransferase-like enzyme